METSPRDEPHYEGEVVEEVHLRRRRTTAVVTTTCTSTTSNPSSGRAALAHTRGNARLGDRADASAKSAERPPRRAAGSVMPFSSGASRQSPQPPAASTDPRSSPSSSPPHTSQAEATGRAHETVRQPNRDDHGRPRDFRTPSTARSSAVSVSRSGSAGKPSLLPVSVPRAEASAVERPVPRSGRQRDSEQQHRPLGATVSTVEHRGSDSGSSSCSAPEEEELRSKALADPAGRLDAPDHSMQEVAGDDHTSSAMKLRFRYDAETSFQTGFLPRPPSFGSDATPVSTTSVPAEALYEAEIIRLNALSEQESLTVEELETKLSAAKAKIAVQDATIASLVRRLQREQGKSDALRRQASTCYSSFAREASLKEALEHEGEQTNELVLALSDKDDTITSLQQELFAVKNACRRQTLALGQCEATVDELRARLRAQEETLQQREQQLRSALTQGDELQALVAQICDEKASVETHLTQQREKTERLRRDVRRANEQLQAAGKRTEQVSRESSSMSEAHAALHEEHKTLHVKFERETAKRKEVEAQLEECEVLVLDMKEEFDREKLAFAGQISALTDKLRSLASDTAEALANAHQSPAPESVCKSPSKEAETLTTAVLNMADEVTAVQKAASGRIASLEREKATLLENTEHLERRLEAAKRALSASVLASNEAVASAKAQQETDRLAAIKALESLTSEIQECTESVMKPSKRATSPQPRVSPEASALVSAVDGVTAEIRTLLSASQRFRGSSGEDEGKSSDVPPDSFRRSGARPSRDVDGEAEGEGRWSDMDRSGELAAAQELIKALRLQLDEASHSESAASERLEKTLDEVQSLRLAEEQHSLAMRGLQQQLVSLKSDNEILERDAGSLRARLKELHAKLTEAEVSHDASSTETAAAVRRSEILRTELDAEILARETAVGRASRLSQLLQKEQQVSDGLRQQLDRASAELSAVKTSHEALESQLQSVRAHQDWHEQSESQGVAKVMAEMDQAISLEYQRFLAEKQAKDELAKRHAELQRTHQAKIEFMAQENHQLRAEVDRLIAQVEETAREVTREARESPPKTSVPVERPGSPLLSPRELAGRRAGAAGAGPSHPSEPQFSTPARSTAAMISLSSDALRTAEKLKSLRRESNERTHHYEAKVKQLQQEVRRLSDEAFRLQSSLETALGDLSFARQYSEQVKSEVQALVNAVGSLRRFEKEGLPMVESTCIEPLRWLRDQILQEAASAKDSRVRLQKLEAVEQNLRTSEGRGRELRGEIQQLETQMAAVTSQLQQARNDLENMSARAARAEAAELSVTSTANDWKQRADEQSAEVVRLEAVVSTKEDLVAELRRLTQDRQDQLVEKQEALHQTRAALQEKESAILTLQQECSRARDALDRSQQERAICQAELSEATNHVRQIQQQLLDAQAASAHASSLRHDAESRSTQLAEANEVAQEEIDQLRSQLRAAEEAAEDSLERAKQAEEHIRSLEQEVTSMRTQLAASKRAEQQLKSAIQTCESRLAEAQDGIGEASAAALEAKANVQELEKRLEAANEKLEEERAAAANSRRRVAETANQLAEVSEQLSTSESELSSCQESVKALQSSLEAKNKEIEVFNRERMSMMKDLHDAREKVDTLTDELSACKTEAHECSTELTVIRTQLASTRKEQTSSLRSISELERYIEELRLTNTKLQDSIVATEAQLTEAQCELTRLSDLHSSMLNDAAAERKAMEEKHSKELCQAQLDVSLARQQHEAEVSARKDLSTLCGSLRHQLDDSKRTAAGMEVELGDARRKLSAVTARLESISEASKDRITELEARIGTLESRISVLKEVNTKLQRANESLEGQLVEFTSEVLRTASSPGPEPVGLSGGASFHATHPSRTVGERSSMSPQASAAGRPSPSKTDRSAEKRRMIKDSKRLLRANEALLAKNKELERALRHLKPK